MLEPIRPKLAIIQPVVFVLDGSASMDWHVGTKSKSSLVRDTLRFIVNYFKSGERSKREGDFSGDYIYIQIIAFDIQPVKYFPDFVRISDLNQDQIESPTDKIRNTLRRSNKGTRISLGLRAARESIESFIIKNELDFRQIYKTAIILLSDGCTNKEDRQPLLQLSEELLKLYQVFVIEFGESGQKAETPDQRRDFHRQSCPEILEKVASPLDTGLLQKIKRVGQKIDSQVKVEELFHGNRGYIRTLNEKHLRVIFITMTTLQMIKK